MIKLEAGQVYINSKGTTRTITFKALCGGIESVWYICPQKVKHPRSHIDSLGEFAAWITRTGATLQETKP